MLEIKMDGHNCQIKHGGDPVMVAAELSSAVSGIYQGFTVKDPVAAAVFKELMKCVVEDKSPVWASEHDMTIIAMAKNGGGSDGSQ